MSEILDYQTFVPRRTAFVKEWLRQTIRQGNASAEWIAHQIGLSNPSLLYKWQDPQAVNKNLRVCDLPIICKESGSFYLLDRLEAVLGRVAVPLSPHDSAALEQVADLLRALADIGLR